ncbi:MAG: hypothetical protein ACRC2T_04910, partial [Thermoguttaceae bacterium]
MQFKSFILVCLYFFTPVTFAVTGEVRVTDINGTEFSGKLHCCDTQKISVTAEPVNGTSGNGSETKDFAADSLLEMLFIKQEGNAEDAENKGVVSPTDSETAAASCVVNLFDGSTILASAFSSDGKTASVTNLSGKSQTLPIERIHFVRFVSVTKKESGVTPASAPTEPASLLELTSDWKRLLQKQSTDDRLIVGSDTLDEFTGIIKEVGQETVKFLLDGEELSVNRKKVVGLIFPQVKQLDTNPTVCFIK